MTAATDSATHSPSAQGAVAPRLCEGIELIGQYEDSGFKEPPYVVRREDGQVLQLPELLYRVAEASDGSHSLEQVAAQAGQAVQRKLAADDVEFLIEEKLRPLGVIAAADGRSPELRKADPLLALTWRKAVVPARAVSFLTALFKPLFLPPVVIALVGAFMAFDVWLFFVHGISQPIRGLIYDPALLVALFGGVVLATAFHETGHATACRYGGAKPGTMGVGLYVIWPVFYTDVTDAYRLGRVGRLRTDLGGVYFNAIFALAVASAYFATGFEPVLVLGMAQIFAILQQLLPLGRLDGYLIMTDLTGVPDMLTRMKSVLRSLIPWREPDERVKELKPWVRVVTSTYLALLAPVLLFIFVMMLLQAPRLFATAYDSLGLHLDEARNAFGASKVFSGIGSGLQMAALVLPIVGMIATTGRVGRRIVLGALAWSAGEPLRRAVVVGGVAGAVGLAAFTWWPNGEYRPIQPGERGTIQDGLSTLSEIPTGRPSLSPERAAELGGAPSIRDQGDPQESGVPPSEQAGNEGVAEAEEAEPTDAPVPGEDTAVPQAGEPNEEGASPEGADDATQAPGDPTTPEPTTTPAPAPEEEPAPAEEEGAG